MKVKGDVSALKVKGDVPNVPVAEVKGDLAHVSTAKGKPCLVIKSNIHYSDYE